MKEVMHEQVSANKDTMFHNTTLEVRKKLDLMCKQSHKTLLGRVQRMYDAIARDYLAVIGPEAGRDHVTGKPEKVARKKVEDVIAQSEAVFAEVLDCDPEQLHSGLVDGSGRAVGDEPEADVEDATEPLIERSDDSVDEDGMAEVEVEPEM